MAASLFKVRAGRVRIDVPAPPGCADGADVLVEVSRYDPPACGPADDETYDTPEAIAAWVADVESTPPLELTAEERAAFDAWQNWRQELKRFNIECVRREFALPVPGNGPVP